MLTQVTLERVSRDHFLSDSRRLRWDCVLRTRRLASAARLGERCSSFFSDVLWIFTGFLLKTERILGRRMLWVAGIIMSLAGSLLSNLVRLFNKKQKKTHKNSP